MARTNKGAAEVDGGFYGDLFREFEKRGVKTVRHQFESRALPNEPQHNAAEVWLGIQEAAEKREAKARHRWTVVTSTLGLFMVVSLGVV